MVRSSLLALSDSAREEKFREYGDNDLIRNYVFKDPFALLVGVLANQQGVRAGGAWMVPIRLRERMGGVLSPRQVAGMPYRIFERHMRQPEPLHAYTRVIARYIHEAAKDVCIRWRGATERIWNTTSSVIELERRFREIRGMGPKKTAMIMKMLVRDWNWCPDNSALIPVAADRLVARVLYRLGLIRTATRGDIEQAGFALNPYYPAGIDDALWLIGRRHCQPEPECALCPFQTFCPKRNIKGSALLTVKY